VGGNVRPFGTPIEHTHSLGIFGNETDEEHKEETIRWVNGDFWVWAGAPWGTMVMCNPKGAHTFLLLQRTTETWVAFGQGRGNLGARPSSGPVCPWQHGRTREVEQPHRHTHDKSQGSAQGRAQDEGCALIQERCQLMCMWAWMGALGPQRGMTIQVSVGS